MKDLVRDSRIELRVATEEKRLIDRASAVSGSSTTDFIRSTMLAASAEAVRAHDFLMLTAEGSSAFVEAIMNPPAPNEKLRTLAAKSGDIPGQAEIRG